eukprot:3732281-Alexandrium_andersonii.AAC.1
MQLQAAYTRCAYQVGPIGRHPRQGSPTGPSPLDRNAALRRYHELATALAEARLSGRRHMWVLHLTV